MTSTEWLMFAGLLLTGGGALLGAAWKISRAITTVSLVTGGLKEDIERLEAAVKANTAALSNGIAGQVRDNGRRLDIVETKLSQL